MESHRARSGHADGLTESYQCLKVMVPIRMEILGVLAIGELNVTQLASELGLDRRHTSMHLSTLLRHGLVTAESDGRERLYRLTDLVQVRDVGDAREWTWSTESGTAATLTMQRDPSWRVIPGDAGVVQRGRNPRSVRRATRSA